MFERLLYIYMCKYMWPISMKMRSSAGRDLFHTYRSLHQFLIWQEEREILVDDLVITHYSIIYYASWYCSLVSVDDDKKRAMILVLVIIIIIERTIVEGRKKSIFLLCLLLFSCNLLVYYQKNGHRSIKSNKMYWSTWMLVVLFHSTPGLHTHTSLYMYGYIQFKKETIFQVAYTYIYIKDRLCVRVTKVSAVM